MEGEVLSGNRNVCDYVIFHVTAIHERGEAERLRVITQGLEILLGVGWGWTSRLWWGTSLTTLKDQCHDTRLYGRCLRYVAAGTQVYTNAWNRHTHTCSHCTVLCAHTPVACVIFGNSVCGMELLRHLSLADHVRSPCRLLCRLLSDIDRWNDITLCIKHIKVTIPAVLSCYRGCVFPLRRQPRRSWILATDPVSKLCKDY